MIFLYIDELVNGRLCVFSYNILDIDARIAWVTCVEQILNNCVTLAEALAKSAFTHVSCTKDKNHLLATKRCCLRRENGCWNLTDMFEIVYEKWTKKRVVMIAGIQFIINVYETLVVVM